MRFVCPFHPACPPANHLFANQARLLTEFGLVRQLECEARLTSFKVAVVFGTRPEAIKLAPVVLAMRADSRFQCRVCVTGQHREMLDQVLTAFSLVPDHDLALMEPNQSLARLTGKAIEALTAHFQNEKPGLVIVQGDTTTTFCAALSAFYSRIPVAHVEAGLRTGDLSAPWPEEANRVMTSRLTSLHFAPTENARQNLLAEGVREATIFVTGNTVIDALLYAISRTRGGNRDYLTLPEALLDRLKTRKMVLITGHRRENFGPGLESICLAIRILAKNFPDVDFVYPVHLNPQVRSTVAEVLNPEGNSEERYTNIHLLGPVPYLDFAYLMDHCLLIVTDSGGIQEEATALGKRLIVTRETTERPEVVETGVAELVGTDTDRILRATSFALHQDRPTDYQINRRSPYGDGQASRRIIELIAETFENGALLRAKAAATVNFIEASREQ